MYTCNTHILKHTWSQKKEVKRFLGKDNPTRFLSFLAVHFNRLCGLLKPTVCVCVCYLEIDEMYLHLCFFNSFSIFK